MEEKDFKIFILDDNISYRNILASRLRLQGYDVDFASGGFHFFHMFEKLRFNIHAVIIHEDMHDMPAQEIMGLIRTHRTKAELPIIYLSKNSNEDIICEMVLAGANDFIVKSDNIAPVTDKIKKYFEARRLKAS